MIAFLEGSMEREFVNRNFRHIRVIPVYNGITWTTERLCMQIVTGFRALDILDEVVVWLDREGRTEPCSDISAAIRNALIEAGADADRIHILVNDRTAENVILADEDLMRAEFSDATYAYGTEGQNGKSIIKGMYRNAQQHYREMQHGVRLLKRVQLANSATCSQSVASFLETFDRECWWIRRPAGELVAAT